MMMNKKEMLGLSMAVLVLGVLLFIFAKTPIEHTPDELSLERNLEERIFDMVSITLPGGDVIEAEVVSTNVDRARGLSGREGLGENEGMLFVFSEPGKYGFWMKDMNFAIDILWLDDEGKIVHIEKDVHPETYPNSFAPDEDALYVLEILAGKAHEQGLVVGDMLPWEQ